VKFSPSHVASTNQVLIIIEDVSHHIKYKKVTKRIESMSDKIKNNNKKQRGSMPRPYVVQYTEAGLYNFLVVSVLPPTF